MPSHQYAGHSIQIPTPIYAPSEQIYKLIICKLVIVHVHYVLSQLSAMAVNLRVMSTIITNNNIALGINNHGPFSLSRRLVHVPLHYSYPDWRGVLSFFLDVSSIIHFDSKMTAKWCVYISHTSYGRERYITSCSSGRFTRPLATAPA